MVNIKVNGKDYQVDAGITLIQALDTISVQVPRFCYHEKLPTVGNCRMCLVSMAGSPKLIASCTTNVFEGMDITTESETIVNSRKTVLELLLVNHPLDCPICDKGGECDLQDQTYRYGLDRSQVNLDKRAVPNKSFGPLIDSYMTRCIHCTRCIRFATEVAGVEEIGRSGRSDLMEIETYVNHTLHSELSGNIADVCPVGALTHANYAFKARPWELKFTDTIDIMDAVGSNIRVNSSSLAVLRILPRINENINEEWLADKSRYITDALRLQRLDVPMARIDGKLQKVTWEQAFATMQAKLNSINATEMAAIAGNFVDVETMFALKELMNNLGSDKHDCRVDNVKFNNKDRASYLFNTTIKGIEESDACLIIGSNPRVEAPIINARLRKRYLKGDFKIAVIGEKYDLNYKYNHIGTNINMLESILNDNHEFCKVLEGAQKPMLILGMGALQNNEKAIDLCKQIALKYNMITEDYNGFNVLHTSASLVSGLEVGFVPNDYNYGVDNIISDIQHSRIKFLWLLGHDDMNFKDLSKDTFIVYQGHHGDKAASIADVVLPGSLWLEKNATYINTEGRVQRAYRAVANVGQAKEDWKIIRKFSEYTKYNLPYNTIEELREKLALEIPIFGNVELTKAHFISDNVVDGRKIIDKDLKSIISNYYLTDIISKNSAKMIECSELFNNKNISK